MLMLFAIITLAFASYFAFRYAIAMPLLPYAAAIFATLPPFSSLADFLRCRHFARRHFRVFIVYALLSLSPFFLRRYFAAWLSLFRCYR